MTVASTLIRELLENGVHFGHQTNKWNPKMKKYIFGQKSGIYIIDLRKTEAAVNSALEMIHDLAAEGKTFLFVGTKKQAKDIIRQESKRCGMFFVDERWLGGCLTNFNTIRKSVDRLNHIQEIKSSDVYATLPKKEKARIDKEEYKLLKNLEGIREMDRTPDCLIAIDSEAEAIAVREANKLGIPVVALIDTNCDPDNIDYPIPGNDDAIRSIKYIIKLIADEIDKGRREFSGTSIAEEMQKPSEDAAPEEVPAEEPVTEEGQPEVKAEEPEPDVEPEESKEEEQSGEKEEQAEYSADEDVEGDIKLDGGQ